MAVTLGHAILGQTDATFDLCRDHEMVHVRQCDNVISISRAFLCRMENLEIIRKWEPLAANKTTT